ncbi:hypothetical protein GCM10023403_02150 [Pseudonocardia benzenivorans]
MRLVDDEQTDARFQQARDDDVLRQLFGGEEHVFGPPVREHLPCVPRPGRGLARVDGDRLRDVTVGESALLVVLQRDQR